jgi:hypothetical protein
MTRYIKIAPEIVEASYWSQNITSVFELNTPSNAAEGTAGFRLVITPTAALKNTVKLSKAITIMGSKSDVLDVNLVSLPLPAKSTPILESEFFQNLEEDDQANFVKYLNRYVAALSTIENATFAASQLPEGSDATIIQQQEKEARTRLNKALRRINKAFESATPENGEEFVPLFMLPDSEIHEEVAHFMSQHGFKN